MPRFGSSDGTVFPVGDMAYVAPENAADALELRRVTRSEPGQPVAFEDGSTRRPAYVASRDEVEGVPPDVHRQRAEAELRKARPSWRLMRAHQLAADVAERTAPEPTDSLAAFGERVEKMLVRKFAESGAALTPGGWLSIAAARRIAEQCRVFADTDIDGPASDEAEGLYAGCAARVHPVDRVMCHRNGLMLTEHFETEILNLL